MMRRTLWVFLLIVVAVVGFGSEFRHHRRHREAFERHVAAVCVEAARASAKAPSGPASGSPESSEEPSW